MERFGAGPNPDFLSEEALREHLGCSGADLSQWGVGAAKTLQHLMREIEAGESIVVLSEDGALERRVGVVWVDVFYADPQGTVYELVEDEQVYHNGGGRKRTLPSSLGEKLVAGEDPDDAALRALAEELNISRSDAMYALGYEHTKHTPDSYPGLETHYDTYSYAAIIGDDDFNPNGYIEVQADKTSYYSWRPLNGRPS